MQNASVEIPACMVESELDYMLQDFEYRLSYMYGGMKLDDYFKYTGSSREDFRKDRKEEAEKSVKTRLVLEAIIKAEKTEPTDEEMNARIAEIAATSGKSAEEYNKTLSDQQRNHIKSDVTVEKTLNELVKANTFEVGAGEEKTGAAQAEKPAAKKSAAAKKSTATKTQSK